MNNTVTDKAIYLLAGIACSLFMFGWNLQTEPPFGGDTIWATLLKWLFVAGIPLLVVFSYPRFIFQDSSTKKRRIYAVLADSVALVAATMMFPRVALRVWSNPVLDNSIFVPIGLFAILVLLFVSAMFLLLNRRSSFAALAGFLIWPYWFLLSLAATGHYFNADPVPFFLSFVAPLFLVFAAGSVAYRMKVPHLMALLGCVCTYWIWSTVLPNQVLGNVWVMFNHESSARWPSSFYMTYAATAILCVAALLISVTTAMTRPLPEGWVWRALPLCKRTWPAFVVCTVFIFGWFKHSVMPYRIPGAVDSDRSPILRMLHLQKHGLQFHEKCIAVIAYRSQLQLVNYLEDDRKLLHYMFERRSASVLQPPQELMGRIQALSATGKPRTAIVIKPVRDWTADNWYVYAEGQGYTLYGTVSGVEPPPEVTDLFKALDSLPKSSYAKSNISDVCLGFCFDPLSAMGSLYANHRCSTDIHGNVSCR
jgi:hypothetical protein